MQEDHQEEELTPRGVWVLEDQDDREVVATVETGHEVVEGLAVRAVTKVAIPGYQVSTLTEWERHIHLTKYLDRG